MAISNTFINTLVWFDLILLQFYYTCNLRSPLLTIIDKHFFHMQMIRHTSIYIVQSSKVSIITF